MGFLALIPGIFTVLDRILGPLFSSGAMSAVVSHIAGGSPTVAGIISAIEGVAGKLEDEKVIEIKAEMETLLAQANIDLVDANSEKFFKYGWRPTLAWGLVTIILVHLFVAESFNIAISFGYSVGHLAPMDTLVVTFMSVLLGVYMKLRTDEKLNRNSEDDQ